MKEIAIWKEKVMESEERCKQITIEERQRAEERVEEQVSHIKKHFIETEEHYKNEIAHLKKKEKSRDGT